MPDTLPEWLLAALTAALVGLSKTGIPGVGILVVPLMAALFGPRLSVGALLPMLIVADVFAVRWYRQHCRWDVIRQVAVPVLVGLALGGAFLAFLGQLKSDRDWLGPTIGGIVLAMLALHLMRARLGERVSLATPAGAAFAGSLAGFTTTVSNAAGPVMAVYFAGIRLTKEEFMGTSAWFYFSINVAKLPVLLALTSLNPAAPLLTPSTIQFNLLCIPAIAVGAIFGRWLLPRIPAQIFEAVILVLAAAGALRLILG